MDADAVAAFIGLFMEEIRARIRAHNESVGTPNSDDNGYHETITRLYVTAIAEHVSRHAQQSFTGSLQALLESPVAARSWPFHYYSRERLLSVAARRGWLPPDLKESIP